MRTLKLTIAYDGTRFVGWQRQAEGQSVQGLVETAIADLEGAPVVAHGAGRTDAGVHALGQVASVRLTTAHDAGTIARAVNAGLPPDVRIVDAQIVPPEFHARFSARSKTYRYLFCNAAVATPFERSYTWHLPQPLRLDTMNRAAELLVGTHDFSAFQSTGTETRSTVRTISSSTVVERPSRPDFLSQSVIAYEITGDGFLRHMVRAIVGTLAEIGRGQRNVDSMEELLATRARSAAGPTAPAHGLFLVRVDYD